MFRAYVEEFLGMAVIGGIGALATCTTTLKPPALTPFEYIVILAILVGAYSIVLKAPHPLLWLLSPVGIWFGIRMKEGYPRLGPALILISFSLMMWVLGELVRFKVRLKYDPQYRERWEKHRRR